MRVVRPTMGSSLIVFFVIFTTTAHCKIWNNPVLDDGDYPDPGVIKVDGVYYVATTTNNDLTEKYPIHSSTDLQNWKFEGYIFNESNLPPWCGGIHHEFWAPELHKVGNEIRAYFTTRANDTGRLVVGVATAATPVGPYSNIATPLVTDTQDVLDATLVQHNDDVILVWRGGLSLWARYLNSDGLSFKDNITMEVTHTSLDWEGATVEGPWIIERNGIFYLFYSGNYFCGPDYQVGVARSKVSPIGPFEKKPDSILGSNDRFKGPGHGSVVRDVDGEGWAFVYHGWKEGQVCDNGHRVLFTSQIEWGDDDWPKNIVIS